nr:uncharacterized protein LOC109165051 [Ipomoea batatas]
MEHPFFITNPNRTEALRWLTIAEKLLANRDLMGSKSFATRAQESDPTMVHGEQILAVIDTLIAGDKLMNNQFDWYGILQVPPNLAHDSEFIATQYRRLALLLNPQKNNFPFADQAFRLVLDAWNLLSNPFRKSVYDKELGFFINLNPNPVPSVQQQQQPPSAFSVVPNSGRDQQQQMFFVSREQQQPFTTGQPLTFLSREPVQTVTFLQQPNTGRDQQPPPPPQPVTFLSRDPPPPVTSVPSLNVDQLPTVAYMPGSSSEPQPFSFTPSSGRAQPQPPPPPPPPPPVAPTESSTVYQQRDEPSLQQNEGFETNYRSGGSTDNEDEADEPKDDIPSFWTACPYCYHMFQYPEAYVDCTLRCQNCKMAFQAVAISSPPPIIDGKEAYFCCWGFLPLGFSVSIWEKYKGQATTWTPFSPMFNCPQTGGKNGFTGGNVYHSVGGQGIGSNVSGFGGGGVKKELSDSSEESDEDWSNGYNKKRKKAKSLKGKGVGTGTPNRTAMKQQADNGNNVKDNAGDNFQDGVTVRSGARLPAELRKKGVTSNTRRQSGRIAKDYGKLDLNVEFSNEVEEPPPGMNGQVDETGREDDGIEGNGFFEGLDEFLNSLPILNAVGDDKVKAA